MVSTPAAHTVDMISDWTLEGGGREKHLIILRIDKQKETFVDGVSNQEYCGPLKLSGISYILLRSKPCSHLQLYLMQAFTLSNQGLRELEQILIKLII